ncbi:MAG: hypothetical protein HYX57_10060 [Chloroflexi bacterium]|nr:hypothetical protein [Chloroflexota bacterium]
MPHAVRALLLAILAGLLAIAPVAASAGPASTSATTASTLAAADTPPLSPAKVVIIVGPTQGATASYKTAADSAYATAIQYSSNVVKVYSPNATWAAVQAAVAGASIVLYLGHGNGWPSPYTWDPQYTTKDGFGLNDPANLTDAVHKYYGEPYVSTLKFAPNAVVLLNRLCYASGNSEPGFPDPTVSVAMQRVDNFGAGFLKAGARAVIAEGVGTVNGMIRDLFTTHQTVLDVWRNQANYNGNEFSFQSSRSPAFRAYMDPRTPTSGYYRSLIGNPDLRTEDVTGVPFSPTDVDPSALTAPGAAEVGANGAAVSTRQDLTGPSTAVPAGLRVRVDALGVSQDVAVASVRSLDGAVAGWTRADSLIPRDSTAPKPWSLAAGPSRIVVGQTSFTIDATLSEPSSWKLTIGGDSGLASQASGGDARAILTWDGRFNGTPAPGGRYTWTLTAIDAFGNEMEGRTGSFLLWDGGGTQYVPLAPARVLDSRVGTGLAGAFMSGSPRTFQVSGIAGVPEDAVAVTGNVTIVGQTSGGYLSVTPTAIASPPTSTLNVPVGDVRANGVTVPLSPTGTLSAVFRGSAGSMAQVIFDVTGYFAPSSAGSTYVSIEPARLLDSRFGNGLSGPFVNATPRSVQIAGRGGVPTAAVAVTGNVTVVGQTSGGYLSVTPAPITLPATSTLNFPVGDARANNFTLPLGPDGTVSAVFRGAGGATVNVIIDVTGYFVPGDGGSSYVPVTPTRALDTRFGTGLSGAFVMGASRTFGVAGTGGIPSAAVGVTGNVTVVGSTSSGYVTVSPTPNDSPTTSTINFPRGDIRANGVNMRLEGGQLSAVFRGSGGATTQLIFDVTGYFLPAD